MTTRGASSDNFIMKAETDLGPLVSLLLNSLFASSLCKVSTGIVIMIASPTLIFHRLIGCSRIVLQEYEGILPSAQTSAQNRSGSVQ